MKKFILSESGQAITDYALLASLVVIGLIILFRSLGQQTSDFFSMVLDEWPE